MYKKTEYDGDWVTAILQQTKPKNDFVYIEDGRTLERWIEKYTQAEHKLVAVDTETTGLSVFNDTLVTIQLYTEGFPPLIIDCRRVDVESQCMYLRPFLTDPSFLFIAHNWAFDWAFLAYHLDIKVPRLFCTKIAENILTAGLSMGADLASTLKRHLDIDMSKEVRLDFTTIGEEDLTEEMLRYAAKDVTLLIDLMYSQYDALYRKKLLPTARLEFKVVPAIAEAHLHGVLIDMDRWRTHIQHLSLERDQIERSLVEQLQPYYDRYAARVFKEKSAQYVEESALYEEAKGAQVTMAQAEYDRVLAEGASKKEARAAFNAYKREHPVPFKRPTAPSIMSGVPINIGSPEQLQGALSIMGVSLPEKDSGKLETDRKALAKVASQHPVVAELLKYRAYDKLVNAYGENLLSQADVQNRLHPEFRQCDTDTGRMSCAKPNVQQIPGNSLGAEFRNCFIAPEGHVLIAADYSQIEIRLLVEFANDEAAIEAINSGLDIHSQTVSTMFGVPYEEVIAKKDTDYKQLRHVAKTINFGLAYGLTPGGLAANINIPMADAKAYFEQWEDANPVIKAWVDKTRETCVRQGYAATALGRKRFATRPTVDRATNPWEYNRQLEGIQRQLCNMVIQGSSADITKMAVCGIRSAGIEELGAHMVMFIHDEIVVEAPEEVAEEVAFIVTTEMERAAREVLKRVEAKVEYNIAPYWKH